MRLRTPIKNVLVFVAIYGGYQAYKVFQAHTHAPETDVMTLAGVALFQTLLGVSIYLIAVEVLARLKK